MKLTVERAAMLHDYWATQKKKLKLHPEIKQLIQWKLNEWELLLQGGSGDDVH